MKPISRELSKAITSDFNEISTAEHNEAEMYLADITESLVLTHGISPGVVSASLLKMIRNYGSACRKQGETDAILKIVDSSLGRLPV